MSETNILSPKNTLQVATLGGGCFWCTEAIFRRLKGVKNVVSGYSGESTGKTDHAEAIQITYDPTEISYEDLLEIFFHLHDPTSVNRQGHDVGTQYRSVIFTHDKNQERIAGKSIEALNASREFSSPIVTDVIPYTSFYEAESYHQQYYEKNSYQPYCQAIIDPKLQKLFKEYKAYVREDALRS